MRIKYLNLLLSFGFIITHINSFVHQVDLPKETIIGLWITHDERAVIDIYKEGNVYFGKIDALLTGTSDKSLIGLTILKDFTVKNEQYVGGTLYDPESKGIFKSKLWLKDENTLMVRDFCGVFYQTFTWKRKK